MSLTLLDPAKQQVTSANWPLPAKPAEGGRLKVLIGAYACSPAQGSEYSVGWGWAEALSKYHDLWILTSAHCRGEIEAELARRPELRSRMHFHYTTRTRSMWAEKYWPPAYLYTYEHQWLRAMYLTGKRLHDEIGFDIIHQLTYVGFRVPGWLWQLDAPFVWGPIGGLEQITWALLPGLGLRGCAYGFVKNLLNERDRRWKRVPKKAFAKAAGGIIAATSGIRKEIYRFYHQDSTVICEVGLPPITRAVPMARLEREPLRLLWCGLLECRKALPLLLKALQQLPSHLQFELAIIGQGSLSAEWKKLARTAGLDDRCTWLGAIPRASVLHQMQVAHALVITSVYDLTSTVLVEALANGLPVICPDHLGFRDAITEECGIKVPATTKRDLVGGLRDAIVRMNDDDFRMRLARGAAMRSLNYAWDIKAKAVSEIYYRKSLTTPTANSSTLLQGRIF